MKQQTLLSGNIARQTISLALPLLFGNILQQLYNTADSLIVGYFLGTDAFASVGISGSVMNLFIFVLNGFCTGLSILFGQLYGMGNHKRFREEAFVAFGFGTAFTVALSVLSALLVNPILVLIQTPKELTVFAAPYLAVVFAGLPFTYFYNLLSGILRSVGNTRAALYFLAAAIVTNMILDWVFIGVFGLGTAGAAAATVISQLLSAACCFLYLRRYYKDLLCTRADVGFHKDLLSKSIGYGFTSALQSSSLYIGKLLVQGVVNTLGTPAIAAYTATMRIEGVANSFGDSCGSAISVVISQNYGAGNKDRVREGIKKGLLINIALGLLLSVLMYAFAAPGIRIFLSEGDTAAIAQGVGYLKAVSVFYVLCFMGCGYVGYFRGTGRLHIPFLATTAHIALRVIFSGLFIGSMGLAGVGLATGIGWILAVAIHTAAYFYYRDKPKASV